MNKLDEWAFWLMKAITQPQTSNNKYFYDKEFDELFALKFQNNGLLPIFRNTITENNIVIVDTFVSKIHKIENFDKSIITLPKLSLEEKKIFLIQFISDIENSSIRNELNNEINSFSESDDFNFKLNLKKANPQLYLKFDMDKGKFIFSKINQIYEPLGITEKSVVIW